MAQATSLYEGGRLQEALQAFRDIEVPAHLPKRRAQKYHNIGVILARLGRYDEASGAMEEALRCDASDAAARELLERLRSNPEEHSEAVGSRAPSPRQPAER